MRLSGKSDTLHVSKSLSAKFETMFLFFSMLAFVSIAGIYFVFI